MPRRSGRLLVHLSLALALAAHALPARPAVAAPAVTPPAAVAPAVAPLVAAAPALSSLGTARGLKAVEQSYQSYGGARWLPLGGRSLPVLEGTRIRTAAGGAVVDLVDGTRIGVLPFSSAAIRTAGRGGGVDRDSSRRTAGARLEIVLERGRLTFRWPATAQAVIRTPAASLEPRRGESAAGEVTVGTVTPGANAPGTTAPGAAAAGVPAAGTAPTGVRLASGRVAVVDAATGAPRVVASRRPVVLPAVAAGVRVFAADDESRPDRSGQPVFGPRGDSVGYLEDARTLVVHPGFASDLTAPFPADVVRRAVAIIPPARRSEATPLFDVAGAAVGYVSGPAFFPMTAQAASGPVFVETLPDEGWPWYYYAAAAVAAGGLGVGIAAAAGGGGGDDSPASPVSP